MDTESKNVVVIDDDRMVREMLSIGCQSIGHQVASYACGTDAIENFTGDAPDFVLVDYDLPDLSGLEIAMRLRSVANGKASPVLAMLTGAIPRELSKIEQLKIFDHILIKPVSIARLQKLIAGS